MGCSAAPNPGSHCRGHQRNGSLVSQGDSKVYQTAKKAAQLQEPEQIMALVIDHPELCSLPCILQKNKKTLRNRAMRREAQAGTKRRVRFQFLSPCNGN